MLKSLTKKPKIMTELITITPEIAKAWLEKNTHNRGMSEPTVRKYIRDMKAGHWHVTGDPIRFSDAGRLLDGQHRLAACARSGASFESFVMYGLDDATQEFVDTGRTRSTADVLALRGLTNSKRIVAAGRALIAYRDDTWKQHIHYSVAEITEIIERHPNITKSVAATEGIMRGIPFATVSMAHYLAKHIASMPDMADAMLAVLRTGIPSYNGDPMHMLREKALRFSDERTFVKHDTTSATFIHVWNMFVRRETPKLIKWVDKMPEMVGVDRSKL